MNSNFRQLVGRRSLPDRRAAPTVFISRYTFLGARRRNRRQSDPRKRYYVDWIDGPFAWALLALVTLIVFDTFSTIFILAKGGLEMNPLMAWVLGQGTGWFVVAKLLPAFLLFPLLAVHRYFFVGRFGTLFLLFAYTWVFSIHLTVLVRING